MNGVFLASFTCFLWVCHQFCVYLATISLPWNSRFRPSDRVKLQKISGAAPREPLWALQHAQTSSCLTTEPLGVTMIPDPWDTPGDYHWKISPAPVVSTFFLGENVIALPLPDRVVVNTTNLNRTLNFTQILHAPSTKTHIHTYFYLQKWIKNTFLQESPRLNFPNTNDFLRRRVRLDCLTPFSLLLQSLEYLEVCR